jgi:hypothetical protein
MVTAIKLRKKLLLQREKVGMRGDKYLIYFLLTQPSPSREGLSYMALTVFGAFLNVKGIIKNE